MVTRSLTNLNVLKITEKNKDNIYYGCNQDWYPTEWQREAGCGPTTACNILLYLKLSKLYDLEKKDNSKEFGLTQMEEAWKYITPAQNGIPSTKLFCQGLKVYIKLKQLNYTCNYIDIPREINLRPDFLTLLAFIEDSIIKDSPVAFLNLCNGDVKNLDSWHWVTIIALKYDKNHNSVLADIIDAGIIKKIDIRLWYSTTMLGGGFVSIATKNDT